MKKTFALFTVLALCLTLCLGLCACGRDSGATEPVSGNEASEEDLKEISLTVPGAYLDENKTQADYDAEASEAGFQSAVLNADGSVTYVMTKARHRELLSGMAAEIDQALSEMIASGEYPNFVSITHNDDYTEFTVVSRAKELDFSEMSASWAITLLSERYAAFRGEEAENCHIEYVNENTGEAFNIANSAEMESALAGLVGAVK